MVRKSCRAMLAVGMIDGDRSDPASPVPCQPGSSIRPQGVQPEGHALEFIQDGRDPGGAGNHLYSSNEAKNWQIAS